MNAMKCHHIFRLLNFIYYKIYLLGINVGTKKLNFLNINIRIRIDISL